MEIMLCGEGDHDIGIEGDTFRPAAPGWMQVLIEKMATRPVSFTTRRRRELMILPRVAPKFKPLPAGHGAKALMAMLLAARSGCKAVVFMVDADSKDPKDHKRIVGEVSTGFNAASSQLAGVACVPIATSESWLLSDPEAWKAVGLGNIKLLPEHPEKCWGARRDPKGGHPHQVFAMVCQAAGLSDNRDSRVLVAEQVDLGTLRTKCPDSFSTFESDLNEVLSSSQV